MWRARIKYHSTTFPFVSHSPWFTICANGLMEKDLLATNAWVPPLCVPPDKPCWIYLETKSVPDYFPIIHWQDWNQQDQIIGWNVRRSNNPSVPKGDWPIVASKIIDGDESTANNQWTDISGDDPGPENTCYYQVTAYNSNCPAEGPF